MNRKELVERISLQADMPKAAAERALTATLESIGAALAGGDEVLLVGFGTFSVRQRAERIGRNPQTGEPLTIEAARIPSFKPGKPLLCRVNGGAE